MKNHDILQAEKIAILQKLNQSIKDGNEENFAQAFTEFSMNIQETVMAEAQSMVQTADTTVLASRGVRQLTSEENKYYQAVIGAMRTSNPKQALAELTVVLPVTTIDAVFDELVAAHPLLDAINFQNTSGLIEFIVNSNTKQLAAWGTLTATIVTELTSGFKKIPLTMTKLSAFLPVAKSMLDLGPAWLDKYIRTVLSEALAFGLEAGIINGTGKDMPIGMNRQVQEGVSVVDGVYPLKVAVPLTSLDPVTYGSLLGGIAVDGKGNPRVVKGVVLICNPTDYLTKIMPATTIRGADGNYVNNVFPFPTTVIQSTEVPAGKAIIGLAERYFMGIGTAKSGKVEYSDEYKFLEDERVYLVKLYGHGMPMDNNAFVYVDISGMTPAQLTVVVSNYEQSLKALSVTSTESATVVGKTAIAVAQSINTGNTYKYKTGATVALPLFKQVLTTGWTAWNGTDEITATTGHKIVIAEVDSSNQARGVGEAVVASKAS